MKQFVEKIILFLNILNIEIGFTWTLGIFIMPPLALFTIANVICHNFLCVKLCLLHLLVFLGARLLLKVALCIWEIID
jgi:hypothetical protein